MGRHRGRALPLRRAPVPGVAEGPQVQHHLGLATSARRRALGQHRRRRLPASRATAWCPWRVCPGSAATFMALGPGGSALAAQGTQVWPPGPGPMGADPARCPARSTSGWASGTSAPTAWSRSNEIWQLRGRRLDRPGPAPRLPRHRAAGPSRTRQGRIFLRNRRQLWRQDAWDGAWIDLSRQLPGQRLQRLSPRWRIPWAASGWAPPRAWPASTGTEAWVLGEAKGLPGGWAGPGLSWTGRAPCGRAARASRSSRAGSSGPTSASTRACPPHGLGHRPHPGRAGLRLHRQRRGRLQGETWTVLPGTEGRTLLAGGGNGKDSLWFGGTGKNEPFNVVFRLDLRPSA